jgi:hypothetical protein
VLILFQFESSLFLGDLLAEVEEDNTRAYHIVEDTHPSCIQEREEACNFHLFLSEKGTGIPFGGAIGIGKWQRFSLSFSSSKRELIIVEAKHMKCFKIKSYGILLCWCWYSVMN